MVPALGDHFPEQLRKDFSGRKLKVGSVFKTYVESIEKEKRWVVVGFSDNNECVATVMINSEINPNVFRTSDLKKLHLKLEPGKEREYITKKCYVDCSQIFEMDATEIKGNVTDDPSCFLGDIEKVELGSIHQLINSARTIPPKTKKKFSL